MCTSYFPETSSVHSMERIGSDTRANHTLASTQQICMGNGTSPMCASHLYVKVGSFGMEKSKFEVTTWALRLI